MTPVLVDANVILDVRQDDPDWLDWSVSQLERLDRTRIRQYFPIVRLISPDPH